MSAAVLALEELSSIEEPHKSIASRWNCAIVPREATPPASHREYETMARRRYQPPTPFKGGNYWWMRVWDTSPTGSRKRQRIKLADSRMPLREAQRIADERLQPMNQGLELTGSAMHLSDFMNSVYMPRYRYMISKYLRPDLGKQCLRDLTDSALEDYFAAKALKVSYPTLSKIRDTLSSILRAAVKVHYLNMNPME